MIDFQSQKVNCYFYGYMQLITLDLVIYFHQQYAQKPRVRYLRRLRWDIRHETPSPLHIHISLIILMDRRNLRLGWLWLFSQAVF